MKLEIHKTGCNETITLNIEPTATVCDLMRQLYDSRDALLEPVPFDAFQQVISVSSVNLYSEHFATKLVPGTPLADYALDESSYIILDNFSVDNFYSILNQLKSRHHSMDSAILTTRTRSHFFGDGTTTEACQEHEDNKALFEMNAGS
ncbi:hypothetical protein Lmor_2006 [Legionella moravica]|uniref:Uncharacterized protein n=1 Tax=Legionella moravica TaxID=39962 RepID=A0A378JWS1_9GAMM|nr:hypothetical protein [Legionella moravica]KTD33455.1 hypothetical protein Lmor_2006 [Legionella moravica]STX61828.1 Uncharacterised protein [Legionella moravica]